MIVRRQDYRPPSFLVDHVDLRFDLDEATTRVCCRLEVVRNHGSDHTDPECFLDGEALALNSVSLDGVRLPDSRYRHVDEGLLVFDVPDRFTLETDVTIHPDRNSDLMGLYAAEGILCTQCEPEAFRRITFFPDRPDVLATYRVTLTADHDRFPVLLANGNPVEERALDQGRHQVVWEDPHPKPSYLFALAAGPLEVLGDTYTTMSGHPVRLGLYTERGASERGRYAMECLKQAMAWDESRYGREYDLDVFNAVAISQYTMGAMENKGLNVFNDRYVLADPALSTDRDYRNIDALIAHEYFHNWSGNRVTCRDWFQLALKEGFTVFREQQYVADHGWSAVRRIEDARLMLERQFVEDAGPLAHPVRPEAYDEIENFYTDTVYSKGAELIRMLSLMTGDRRFRAACDLYFARHDGRAAVVEDFLECVAEVADLDLSQFSRWYAQPGTPRVVVNGQYDEKRGVYDLTIEQQVAGEASNLRFPLAIGFLSEQGEGLCFRSDGEDELTDKSRLLDVHAPTQHFRFHGFEQRPVPSLLRNFSAPVDMVFDVATEDLAVLAAHDPDAFVRWDAIQGLVARSVNEGMREREAVESRRLLTACFAKVLAGARDDPALSALMLEMPGVMIIARRTGSAELEHLHAVRASLHGHLGEALADRFSGLYKELEVVGDDRIDADAIGRRALRNVCLSYLSASGDRRSRDRCLAHYRQADNMTDRLAALELLAEHGGGQCDWALSDFYSRWRDEPISMDKWFAVQARSGQREGLERALALTRNPLFDFNKPNRVRSVVEVFCTDNPLGFNHPDGSGYRFLADCVMRVDPINPPLAAGLLRHMVNWTGCSPGLHALRVAELDRLEAIPELSEQSREIVLAGLGSR